jgi:hypothetical protein
MEPIKFKGANVVYGAEQPEYQPLPAQQVPGPSGQIITCWEMSPAEIEMVQETGKIWLSMLTFHQPLQPVHLSVVKPDTYDQG